MNSHSTGKKATHAMILTSFPFALADIFSANFAARASIDPDGGTAATITSIPFSASASVMPRQYWRPGNAGPANRSSSKPRRPCARTMLFLW